MAAGPVPSEHALLDRPPEGGAGRLPRSLGSWSAAAVVVGMIVGSGIFKVPGPVAAEVGTVGAMALLWALGGAVALAGALAVAELSTAFPRAGGIYVYLREAYGRLPAFLFGWTDFLIVRPGTSAAVGLIFSSSLATFVPLSDAARRLVAAALILLLAAAHYRSTGWGAALQNASSLAKLLALFGVALALLALGDPAGGALAGPIVLEPASWGGFGVALIAVMWAYDGWADVGAMAGEVREPGRSLPRAIALGMGGVIVAYLAVNAGYLYVLPVADMAASDLVAADAATRGFGRAGAALVAALVMLATFGTLNANVMTAPRFIFAVAADGLFFRRVAAVHPVHGTPHVAIAVTTALGLLYVSHPTFEQLTSWIILGEWPFYTLAVAAVVVLRRRRPGLARPYRMPGYPWLPLAFVLASLALMGNALVEQPALTAVGFGVILSGVPAYYLWRARRPAPAGES